MAGSSFFDHFSFFSSADPTGGQVDYVTSSVATSSKLAYVGSDGVAVMKVDNSTWLSSGQSRKSVRVQSNKAYSSGLMIFDVASMPYGCSVWPAMWTVGPNWPEGGEIDIIENVNNATVNQVTLHTGESTSCTTNAVSKAAVSTSMLGTTCASSQTADAGCAFQDTSSSAFGAGFNAAGGAVFALWIDQGNSANNGAGGVTVWKFARDSVPSDITSGSPNPLSSAWGTPQATWPATSSCKTSAVIGAQQVVFDITLCGGWCASDYGNSGCPGTCSERIEDPTNFNTAAWRINSVKVYQ
ncbi:hypothetical protein DL93DRAFT_2067367 [Clavulina sp. PMI_390]|nr:hypothetical protein DL93DRAFT_2067367 [Clavulina sp. PMI_390]